MIRVCLIVALILTSDTLPKEVLRKVSPHCAYSSKQNKKNRKETKNFPTSNQTYLTHN